MPRKRGEKVDTAWVDATVAANLMRLRKQRGLARAELARLVGVSVPHIQKCETAASRINVGLLCMFASALDSKIEPFFEPLPDLEDQEAR